MAEYVEMTVARALTKIKVAKDKIRKEISSISDNAGIHSKELSVLSSERDLGRNHKDASNKMLSVLQSIGSLQSYVVTVKTAIQQSNLVTTINSDVFGEIPIAAALIMTTDLKESYKDVQDAGRRAASRAETKANMYNSQNFSKSALDTMDPAAVDAILAKPYPLLSKEDLDTIDNNYMSIANELNNLINESNAVTLIKVPDVRIL